METKLLNQLSLLSVSIAEAKNYIKTQQTDDDDYIEHSIKLAQSVFEMKAGIKLFNASMEAFVSGNGWIPNNLFSPQTPTNYLYNNNYPAKLPYNPTAITAIKFYDNNNVETTIDPTTYELYGRKVLIKDYDAFFLINPRVVKPLVIEYTAGFGALAEDIPVDIKLAIKRSVAIMYADRGVREHQQFQDPMADEMFESTLRIYKQYSI